MKQPEPRSNSVWGAYPTYLSLGTWIESEAITYPSGSMTRRARAYNTVTGRLNVVRCGIADTYFTVPVSGGGYLDISDGGILRYNPPKEKYETRH